MAEVCQGVVAWAQGAVAGQQPITEALSLTLMAMTIQGQQGGPEGLVPGAPQEVGAGNAAMLKNFFWT